MGINEREYEREQHNGAMMVDHVGIPFDNHTHLFQRFPDPIPS